MKVCLYLGGAQSRGAPFCFLFGVFGGFSAFVFETIVCVMCLRSWEWKSTQAALTKVNGEEDADEAENHQAEKGEHQLKQK